MGKHKKHKKHSHSYATQGKQIRYVGWVGVQVTQNVHVALLWWALNGMRTLSQLACSLCAVHVVARNQSLINWTVHPLASIKTLFSTLYFYFSAPLPDTKLHLCTTLPGTSHSCTRTPPSTESDHRPSQPAGG